MSTETSSQKPYDVDESLWKGLRFSVIFHVLLVAFFTVRAVFFAPEKIDYQSAIRIDMVGLPDKVMPDKLLPPAPPSPKSEAKEDVKTPEPPKAAPKPIPKLEPKTVAKIPKVKDVKDPEAINISKEKKQKAALEKLKAMTALDELKAEAEKENKKNAAASAKPSAPSNKIKGNILSPGTELTGLSKLQHDDYLALLDQQIKRHWVLPPYLSKKPYRAQVRVRIDDKGRILSREIALSSGNSSYDDLTLSTIDDSAPFPPPPEKFTSILAVNGLLIGFPE